MRHVRQGIALAASALLAVTLAACGGLSGSAEPELEVASYQVEVQKPFTGREARDASELDALVEQALEVAKDREKKTPADAEEAAYAKRVNKKFGKANTSYREGDYVKAQERYESVLDSYHEHYGANVNLTLALLQQEKADEALVQALACCHIFPNESEPLLNVQVAGAACGFAAEDVEGALREVLKDAGGDFDSLVGALSGSYDDFYAYNQLWDRIETELRADDAGQEDDDEGAEQGGEASEGNVSAALAERSRAYDKLDGSLTDLERELPDDTDVQALRGYLYAVGLQLGYEADPSLIEPVHTMPYVAVDSDICRIEVQGISQANGHWMVQFSLDNKSDSHLSVGHGGAWSVNGEEVNEYLSEMAIDPEETRAFTLELTGHGDAAEQEARSLAGTLYITSREENSVLAVYPVSWEAAE